MSCVCQSNYLYPCLYGNDAVTETSDCESYWKAADIPITEDIEADTFYTSNNQACANTLARELVSYRLNEAAPCDPCCSLALCIDLATPEDIQYLEYSTVTGGLLFSDAVEPFIFVCFSKLNNCPDQDLPILYTLETAPDGQPTTTFFGNTGFGDNCWPLATGRVWRLKIGSVFADQEPTWYNWGFLCDQTCYPPFQFTSFTTFPSGISVCYPKDL